MGNKKTPSTKTKLNEIVKAAGPRRPLRKPPAKPKPSSSSSRPTSSKPAQPSKSSKPSKK